MTEMGLPKLKRLSRGKYSSEVSPIITSVVIEGSETGKQDQIPFLIKEGKGMFNPIGPLLS